MKSLLVLLAGLALTAGLQAQSVTGISGTVIDASTRQPIAGATVCCYVANAHTDSAGNYLISDLRPGRYRVRAFATGYEMAYYPESVDVVEGQITDHIDFFLTRTGGQYGCISGRVTDSRTGQVINDAEVRAVGPNGHRGTLQGSTGYRIESLPAGKYWVSADMPGYEPGNYPESVLVVAGQNCERVDFTLTPVGGQTGGISGWVFDANTRQPIEGALVCCGTGPVHTDSNGYYLIDGLEPRRYQVRCEAAGYQNATYPESVTVVAGRVTENINFHLQPAGQNPGAISGRVFDSSNGRLILGAVVRAANGRMSREVVQCSLGYRITDLAPGKYWVSATARGFEPGHYADSVEVLAGQTTPNINFHLAPTGGQTGGISGWVTNARTREPVFGARVAAEGPSRGRANTCQRGGYAVRDLLPGEYLVKATARGFNPSAVETVTVVAGRITPDVNFALEPLGGGTGVVFGHVRDSTTGQGLRGANVFAWGAPGQGSATTESCGGYLLRELRAGGYVVRARCRGYYHKLYPETVFVVAGETTRNIDFLLRPVQGVDGGLGGFVFDGENQNEISGARVLAIGTGGSREAYTDAFGDYLVDGLEPGDYQIEVEAAGYEAASYPDPVTVEAGVITAFVSPAVYPLTGMAESRPQKVTDESILRVEPSICLGHATVRVPAVETGPVELRILDHSGRLVRTLATAQSSISGRQSEVIMTWDGLNDLGRRVPAGVYFLRLTATGFTATQKLVVQR
jgi:protocatechuate 3,4-dioxygenase beta subunit